MAFAWHPAIAPAAPGTAVDPALVRRGAALALIGDCASCHSAPGRPAYAGGLPIATPFGTVWASNLTPDRDTGIGLWSEAAFRRAMREGIDRRGRNLYPAFPYDHFTRVDDADDAALYAFLMSRNPVRSETPKPDLRFPLNLRPVVAGWNLLFLKAGPFVPDASRDAVWNRGAYLVEGLGHCGACHTPRNALGAEERDRALAGGEAEGWNAYALDATSPAPVPWTVDALTHYLRQGFAADHGVSRGPMALVTANLGAVPEGEARSMAVYLVSRMGPSSSERVAVASARAAETPGPIPAASAGSQIASPVLPDDPGGAIYAGACASCHESGRPVPSGGLPLALSSALHAPDPSNIVTVTLRGLASPPGGRGAVMPGFAGALDDGQLAALLRYLRTDVAHEPDWPGLAETVRRARATPTASVPSDAVAAAPAPRETRNTP